MLNIHFSKDRFSKNGYWGTGKVSRECPFPPSEVSDCYLPNESKLFKGYSQAMTLRWALCVGCMSRRCSCLYVAEYLRLCNYLRSKASATAHSHITYLTLAYE
jgi:hypothetical protein